MNSATDLAQKEFGKVQRTALLKATGCMANTSLETLEIISNCTQMHLHLKLRQAEEMIRIYSKNEGEQILEDLNIKQYGRYNSQRKENHLQYASFDFQHSVRAYAVIISKYATKIVGTQKRQVACVHGTQDQKQSTFNTFKPGQ